jgi:hypothetical protein
MGRRFWDLNNHFIVGYSFSQSITKNWEINIQNQAGLLYVSTKKRRD